MNSTANAESTAAAGAQGGDAGAGLCHHLEIVTHGEGGALEEGAQHVSAVVRRGEAEQGAAAASAHSAIQALARTS